ncbi:putative transcriptional regulator, TetR family protein [Actinoplanes philippinensis]|uniref:TetR/AcrR family transcriptional regulator, tetracycline repressor protein n=1 Tax=Actinoplanes philippinensis TaxID=35752 RepID=A0A1I2KGE1_9ACTN|nr:TetR/AcrR family transcriptional regulator C-terminal domain-containing protein [Actinoplanes philippinensis]GIE82024.1 putative transcriptional regulator, TetR family protein [Actinoplanes philippinensis]SFF65533.1 TetR/AcrR family transcriptional regulator, tetracycline repressor protein [Actinoplanes philippinensis]
MTKRQESARLSTSAVVRAAVQQLDDEGLEGLSTRAVADRLGVRMNTVLWHVKTKARMLDLMADAVTGEVSLDGLPDNPGQRVREIGRRLRAAALAHRDGAALIVGTYPAEPNTLRLAETLIGACVDAGLSDRDAAWTAWTLIYFVLGLTQEEQAAPGPEENRLSAAVATGDFPMLRRVLPHLDVGAFDERFEFGLDNILGHLRR